MYCNKNAKIIAAIAALAMMFAGFGVLIAAGASDADEEVPEVPVVVEPALIDGSIVVKDSVVADYANSDDGLLLVIDADLYLKDGRVANVDAHLKAFAGAIWTYFPGAEMTFIVPYKVATEGKTVGDIVPATYLPFFDETAFTLNVAEEKDFDVFSTIVNKESYQEVQFQPAIDVEIVAVAAEGVGVYSDDIVHEMIDEAVATEIAKKDAVIADKDAALEQKDAKIADLEKEIAAAADEKDGDATIAWCVAALGIIAAVALAGFVLIIFRKANKEGRRLI